MAVLVALPAIETILYWSDNALGDRLLGVKQVGVSLKPDKQADKQTNKQTSRQELGVIELVFNHQAIYQLSIYPAT